MKPTRSRQTPLIVLCRSHIDKVATASVLVSAGAAPRIADHAQKTALHLAALAYRATRGLTALLVGAGASPDAVDADGNTPLHVAMLRENKAVVIAIWSTVRALGTRNGEGKSALELAIDKGDISIGRLLDASLLVARPLAACSQLLYCGLLTRLGRFLRATPSLNFASPLEEWTRNYESLDGFRIYDMITVRRTLCRTVNQ